MTSQLDTLSDHGGSLHREPPDRHEFQGLVRSGRARLEDARKPDNSLESRFDLAYNASHALCLAALRRLGYRPVKRYIVFQSVPYTLGLGPEVWRILDQSHNLRNRSEYEGESSLSERLVLDLVAACEKILDALEKLPLPPES